MKKTRLNKSHREILKEYGKGKIESLIDRSREKELYGLLVCGANAAIAAKFPPKHMEILKTYSLSTNASTYSAIRFQFPSGRVDGILFKEGEIISLIPQYQHSAVYPVDQTFEAMFDEYSKIAKNNNAEESKKLIVFEGLVDAAKHLDDVLEIIELPKEVLERLGGKWGALTALSPDALERLKADFTLKPPAKVRKAA